MKVPSCFDVIIIGGSYAGLATAMTLGRALRQVLVIDSSDPCNKQTPYSHNFLTNDGKTPGQIAALARQQVAAYTSVQFVDALATAAIKTEWGFEVQTATGIIFTARKLVLATGIKDVIPDIPGLSVCWGKTVIHCPYCHGFEVRHQPTGILSNGDAAFEMASLISNWTNDLTVYTNGQSTLSQIQFNKLSKHNIGIEQKEIQLIEQEDGSMQHIVFTDGAKIQLNILYARFPFIQHSAIAQELGCELSTDGYINIDSSQRTTVHGVYACGDNTTRMRTVANAVAMGTATGIMLNKEFIGEEF